MDKGCPDLIRNATARKERIRAAPGAARFAPARVGASRDRFDIRLPA